MTGYVYPPGLDLSYSVAKTKSVGSSREVVPVVLHTRVISDSGGGPDKTILNSPRFLMSHGYRAVCAYMHPPADAGFTDLRKRAADCEAPLIEIVDRGAWDWRVASDMLRICRREGVTIWHGHDYKSNVLGLLLNRLWPMRLVTTVHGWGMTGGRRSFYYAIDRLSLRFYERVICVSPDLLAQCIAAGVPEARCRLVENAIDIEQFVRREPSEAAKRRLGFTPGRLLVGAVGRLSAEKGFDRLIGALRQLLGDGWDVEACIVGEGQERVALDRLIAQHNLQSRVRLFGYQANPLDWYHAMDIFVLSSLREGLPNVLLEAMALEVPVVATRIAGVPRLVHDGENGLLVEPDDVMGLCRAIRMLAENRELRARLARAGRETVETSYSFAVRMQKIRAIYDELLGRACAAPRSSLGAQ